MPLTYDLLYDSSTKHLIEHLSELKHPIFTDDSKPFNLNIVGLRNMESEKLNRFAGCIALIFKFNGMWKGIVCRATTLPGKYWLENPMNRNGTAILKEGHHPKMFKVGLHKGEPALQQYTAVTVYRDNNGDSMPDKGGPKDRGMFGINLHDAHEDVVVQNVGRWSAGCQVVQAAEDMNMIVEWAEQSEFNWGVGMSYTLITI